MAKEKHLKILKKCIAHNVELWNKWRKENYHIIPKLNNANLNGAWLCKALLVGVKLNGTNLSNANLSKANLYRADLNCADLSEANLRFTKLNETNLRNAKLIGTELYKSNIFKADLTKTDLTGANLHKADISKADLTKAKLKNANLSRANFRFTNLSDADLSDANLRFANLSNANLSNANLSNANLFGAKLLHTNLSNAKITGAWLYGSARTDWKIDGIKCDYIYFDVSGKERNPEDRYFHLNEFEELYKQLPTFEYYFKNGFMPLDTLIMDQITQTISKKHPEYELKIDSFHSRGQPHVVFTIRDKEWKQSALQQISNEYEAKLRYLEGQRDQLMELFMKVINQPKTMLQRCQIGIVGDSADVDDGIKLSRQGDDINVKGRDISHAKNDGKAEVNKDK